jgi:hypothetical protein
MEMSAKNQVIIGIAHSLGGHMTADYILNEWCVAESRPRSDWMTVYYEANIRIYPLYDPPLFITRFWPSHFGPQKAHFLLDPVIPDGVDEVGEVYAAYIASGLGEASSRWTCTPAQNQFEVDGFGKLR